MTIELEFHDAASIFPLDEEHLDELAGDIHTNGQLVAIELLNGKILDGRRRYLACQRIGVEPTFTEVNPDDPAIHVASLNLHRRHLDASQRGIVAARMINFYIDAAEKRQQAALEQGNRTKHGNGSIVEKLPQSSMGKSRDKAGDAVGVSGRTVDFATRVLKHGSERLVKAVETGSISVFVANELSKLPKKKQDEELDSTATKSLKKLREQNGSPRKLNPLKTETLESDWEKFNSAILRLEKISKKDSLRISAIELRELVSEIKKIADRLSDQRAKK